MFYRFFVIASFALGVCVSAAAQSAPPASRAALKPGEVRATRAFEAAKKAGAPSLYAFLKPMPKGADLHMHLSGAIYAETFLAEGVKQGLCVDVAKLAFAIAPKGSHCPESQLSAADAVKDQQLYDRLINSFSMRSFVPYAGFSAHDQFFTTFDRFRGLDGMGGEWLDEVATRAAAQNEQYLEIMQTPSFNHASAIAYKVGWPAEFNDANHMQVLAKLRDELIAGGLKDDVVIDRKELSDAEHERESREQADCLRYTPPGWTSERASKAASPACMVKIYFLYQVLRGFPPQQVFAQTLLGFELASADPDVVGINFVRAEDRHDAMAEYHTEMLMLDYLHSAYPNVHISLHAGELAPGVVPPDGMTFHIREAVELGHAERIGHGIDVLHEDRPNELLKEMADKHIMVEINLTSNDVILGVKGTDHPLAAYRAARVPAALSTDDEGVSRINLTNEYVRGALEQNLSYIDLKNMARTALEHSFLRGESLWTAKDDFARRSADCSAAIAPSSKPDTKCEAFLAKSEKASEQWELERRFAVFEASAR